MLLVFGAPSQLLSLAGQEHGRTIPLADIPSNIIALGAQLSRCDVILRQLVEQRLGIF